MNVMFMQRALFEVYCEIVCGLLKAVCQVYLAPVLRGISSVFYFSCFFVPFVAKIYLALKQSNLDSLVIRNESMVRVINTVTQVFYLL